MNFFHNQLSNGVWSKDNTQTSSKLAIQQLETLIRKESLRQTIFKIELELSLNLGRSFTWTFVKADVLFATLGLDFLTHFGLWVDARRGRLVLPDENPVKPPYIFGDTRSSEAVAGTSPEIDCLSPPVCIDSEVTPIQDPKELFDRYSEVFDLKNFKKPVRHKTKHFINTRGPPTCQRVRRLSPEKLEILRVEL